jgi:uncharacterized protein (TIGR00725 family)
MTNTQVIIGVMGPGNEASEADVKRAFEVGKQIAEKGWVLLTGGRNVGVMDAANKGAKAGGGLTIGILPGKDTQEMSESVDIPIITGMGGARNNINVLSSQVVVVCGMGAGTASEVALAVKAQKQVVLLTDNKKAQDFFVSLNKKNVTIVETAEEAVTTVEKLRTNL